MPTIFRSVFFIFFLVKAEVKTLFRPHIGKSPHQLGQRQRLEGH